MLQAIMPTWTALNADHRMLGSRLQPESIQSTPSVIILKATECCSECVPKIHDLPSLNRLTCLSLVLALGSKAKSGQAKSLLKLNCSCAGCLRMLAQSSARQRGQGPGGRRAGGVGSGQVICLLVSPAIWPFTFQRIVQQRLHLVKASGAVASATNHPCFAKRDKQGNDR